MLLRLLSRTDRSAFQSAVVTLMGETDLDAEVRALGIPVWNLNMARGRVSGVRMLPRLRRTATDFGPDVIQGWMYHGNTMASALRFLSRRRVPILWSIHNSIYDLGREKKTTRWIIRAGIPLSHFVSRVIYCSWMSARQHVNLGYASGRQVVIPNGFDCDWFRPNQEARRAFRVSLNAADSDVLIGLIARHDPAKDHETFFRAAGIIVKHQSNIRFVLVGRDVDQTNPSIVAMMKRAHLPAGHVHLLGERKDVNRIMPGLDIGGLSSCSEAFPTVVGEAMACGVPCVVTDVGDSARIVGDTGHVVPPRDPEALAKAWLHLARLSGDDREAMGRRARKRIEQNFELNTIVAEYEALYREVLGTPE